VHSLLNVVRPDRQTLLFSATLPRKIEALVAEALSNPVRISVGLLGAANADVTQKVEILKGK
jgi:ATP-dependent RNA helicase DDX42